MNWTNPWPILGIAPTRDQTAIRRAYAARLKVTNPEDDAEGFQALRAAYDNARRIAEHMHDDEDADLEDPYDDEEARADEDADAAFAASRPVGPSPEAEAPLPDFGPSAGLEPTGAERPWGAAREATEHVTRGELDALNADLARLAEIIHAATVDRDAARQALRAVLVSPALDSMDIREQAEHRIGTLILNGGLGAAVLIDPSSQAFGWDTERVGARSPLGHAVQARRDDLTYLLTIQSPGSELHGVWKALSEKPTGLRLVWNRLTVGLPGQVRRVLETVYQQHRSLIDAFDPDALAWWQKRLEGAWFGPLMVWTTVVAPLFLTPILVGADLFGKDKGGAFAIAYPTLLGSVLALLGGLLGVLRLQGLWREQREYQATRWETLGWAPLALAGLAGAALAPAAGPFFAVAGAVALVWSMVTATTYQATRMVETTWSFPASWFPYIQIPFTAPVWLLRTFGLLALYIFLIWSLEAPLAGAWSALALPVTAAGLAFVAGHERLQDEWRELDGRIKLGVLVAALVAVAALPFGLWAASPGVELAPLGIAAVTMIVLGERVLSLGAPPSVARDQLYHLGWLPAVVAAVLADEGARHGNAALLFLGIWLLAGAAAGLLAELRRVRWEQAPAYA